MDKSFENGGGEGHTGTVVVQNELIHETLQSVKKPWQRPRKYYGNHKKLPLQGQAYLS
jgi:hypothetical protein